MLEFIPFIFLLNIESVFIASYQISRGFPSGSAVKNPPAIQELQVQPWIGKIPWRRAWQPTPAFLPGESHRQRSLVGYSPQGHKSQTRLKQLSTHTPDKWNILLMSVIYMRDPVFYASSEMDPEMP